MARNVEQTEAVQALLARLGPEARHELQDRLGPIGRDIAAAQQALTPVLRGKPRKDRVPGFIRAQIRSQLDVQGLRVIVGLPEFKGGRDSRFYARWLEFGRNAGQKQVTRRTRAGKVTYTLKWPALPRRRFIHIENQARDMASARLADFWDTVLSKAGG